jgi:hypothetical protein
MKFIVENGISIDEGKLHKAELISIKSGSSEGSGDYLRFLFRLMDDPRRSLVSSICPAYMAIGNQLYNWATLLNGSAPNVGEEIDLNQFIGCVVELTVKNDTRDGRVFTNVTNIVKLLKLDGNVNN